MIPKMMFANKWFLLVIAAAMVSLSPVASFVPGHVLQKLSPVASFVPGHVLRAGGFEWEDPVEAFDQAVENPFKNTELANTEDGMKIDPARLLGPRLNGSNLYLIGMMGTGKSAVGDIVARRKYCMH
jgi:shikimate kinase